MRDHDGGWGLFADTIGYARLGLLYLNVSAAPLGAKRDRHALMGEGFLGNAPFKRNMQDPHLAKVPKTPTGRALVTNDQTMLKKLRAFARA